MDISRSIRGALTIFGALVLALWLGISLATNQTETVIKFAAAAMLLVCIFLGRKIWLLLVFFVALNVPLIRGFTTVELGQALFLGFTFIIFLLRRQPLNLKFGELEVWMLLIAACVVQVYLRNPVGLGLFGAGSVGGRPYFVTALAFATGIVLGNIVVQPNELKWSMKLTIIGSFLGMALSALRMRGIGGGGISVSANTTMGESQVAARIGTLGSLGSTISRIVASYVFPLRALLHPLWAPLILLSVAAAAGSGYRNNVAYVGLIYLIAIAYRGGFIAVAIAVISGALGLGALALWNLAVPLPGNIQRALSPFPGTWEERYVKAADDSTEWRVEMWKEALFTEYWIHNKILGDGLGLTEKEHQMLQSMEEGGRGLGSMASGMSAQQEAMMITGGYHSGPVQCIRIIGYAGLLIVVLAMIRVAVLAHHQILRCRGTEWYPLALFFGIPAIAHPIIYVLIFGDFAKDVSAFFFFYGMIRLLDKNLPLPAYAKPKWTPYMLRSKDSTMPEDRSLASK